MSSQWRTELFQFLISPASFILRVEVIMIAIISTQALILQNMILEVRGT